MRLFGITIPDNKRVEYGLTELYGVGHTRALKVLEAARIDPATKGKDITSEQETQIREILETYTLEGDLRREGSYNIKRLKDITSYRGMRHARNLPARGQRTKTNSRTTRGNKRMTMGSGRRKVEKT